MLLQEPIVSVGFIMCLGIFAEWFAWRLSVPSILPLLIFGLLAGPVLHVVNPDHLFGELLRPIVSLSAAVILYEGGLSLNFKELSLHGPVIKNLLSVGTLINWVIVAVAGVFLLNLNLSLAILLGSVMIITGPTAMGPILRHAKLTSKLNSILKWEGIFNGPIGAMLVVIVFDAILHGQLDHADGTALSSFPLFMFLIGVLRFIAIGLGVGAIGAICMIQLFRFRLIPDFLQSTTSLGFLFVFFILANFMQKDAGLLAATVMGLLIANQKITAVTHIIQFKENLRLLLISTLFIVLASRLNIQDLSLIDFNSILYTLVVMFVARPLGVLIATRKTGLSLRERLFIGLLNPKGIVAASIGAIVALKLQDAQIPNADMLMPMIFFVILVTIISYSLTISPIARLLKLSQSNPQGILLVGAHTWARALAKHLEATQHKVTLIDTNAMNVETANKEGLTAFSANVLSEGITEDERLDFSQLGYMLALTPNDEYNALTTIRVAEYFDPDHLYQVQPSKPDDHSNEDVFANQVRGHFLFDASLSFTTMTHLANRGATIDTFEITKDQTLDTLYEQYHYDRAIPLFLINDSEELHFFTTDDQPKATLGSTLFVLFKPHAKRQQSDSA